MWLQPHSPCVLGAAAAAVGTQQASKPGPAALPAAGLHGATHAAAVQLWRQGTSSVVVCSNSGGLHTSPTL
jgi:hypothetical protein